MSSLYARKAKPFQHSPNNSDVDEDIDFFKEKKPSVPTSKRKAEAMIESKPKTSKKSIKEVVLSDDDDEEECFEDRVNEFARTISTQSAAKHSPIKLPDVVVLASNDKALHSTKELLAKSKSITKKMVEIEEIDDLTTQNCNRLIIPKIQSSRIKHAEKSDVVDLDEPLENDFNKLKLRTRLNGKHEWKFKVNPKESFAKFKIKYSEIYGVTVKEIKLSFDGDNISDGSTPEKLNLEDDDLIDIKVNKDLYDKAVQHAESTKMQDREAHHVSNNNNNNNKSEQQQQQQIQQQIIVGGPRIKLKTRLNGKHEWKWIVPKCESFSKMKIKFAEIYGLSNNIKDIKFNFDGDNLQDADTPEDIDMEDDNIIDVKIPKDLVDNAIKKADASKSKA